MKEINEMIDLADNVNLSKKSTWWFDREHQRRYIFKIQCDLVVAGLDPKEALQVANDTVDEYYSRHVNTMTRDEI